MVLHCNLPGSILSNNHMSELLLVGWGYHVGEAVEEGVQRRPRGVDVHPGSVAAAPARSDPPEDAGVD